MIKNLGVFANKLVFKFETPTKDNVGEVAGLLGNIGLEDFKEFILKLNNEKYVTFYKRFKKFKKEEDYGIPVLIDWTKVFDDGLMKDTLIYDFYIKNPKAFEVTFNKTKYLAQIDGMGYKEPSMSLYSLDQLMMAYFTDMTKYEKHFEQGSVPKVEDIYSNIRFLVAVTGYDDKDIYGVNTYAELMKDFGITIDKNIMKALEETANKALKNNIVNIGLLNSSMRNTI